MHRSSLLLLCLQVCAVARAATFFNLTATAAANGKSTLECWQLLDPETVSAQSGIAGAALLPLGNVANASYTIIPPLFDGGAHVAPVVQYVLFSSGLAHITLPYSKDEAWIFGGKFGLIVATDVAAVSAKGHITRYPSGEQTTALTLPTADGKVPRHRVLHRGACAQSELEY